MRTVLRASLLVLVTLCLEASFPAETSAQSLGSYRWQLQPYCNILTLSAFQVAGGIVLEGFDDHCGATRTAVVGSAFLNLDGSIALGLTTILASGGASVHLEANSAVRARRASTAVDDGHVGDRNGCSLSYRSGDGECRG